MPNLLTLDTPTVAIGNRALDAFAIVHGYSGVDNTGAAETKQQFFKRCVINVLKDAVKQVEAAAAGNAARAAAEALIDSQVALT